MQTLGEEIAEMFDDLSRAECDGLDPLTYAARYHLDRWADYEEERRERRETDETYDRERREQLSRANDNRKAKRRGDHLSNAERVRLADDIRAGRDPSEVAAEHKLGIGTAEKIGQLRLWEPEAA